jgi:photosystem II stability/assembly factor-like uncharacterized protein
MRTFATTTLLVLALPASGRAQWDVRRVEPKTEYRSVHAVSDSVIWAGGRGGIVAHSLDGHTWTADSVPGARNLFFIGIWAADADTAVALGTGFEGSSAAVQRTVDGGRTWTRTYHDERDGVFFDGLAFWENGRGVAFGDPIDGAFLVITTADGGASWQEVPRAALPPPLDGEAGFAASGRALVTLPGGHAWIGTGGGARARVLHTHDYGVTWDAAETPLAGGTTAGIFALAFRDAHNGLAVGGDYTQRTSATPNVLRTSDGGRTWKVAGTTEPTGVRYGITAVPGATSDMYVAVGPSGSGVTQDAGATWEVIDRAHWNTVVFASRGIGWVLGTDGRVGRWGADR